MVIIYLFGDFSEVPLELYSNEDKRQSLGDFETHTFSCFFKYFIIRKCFFNYFHEFSNDFYNYKLKT